MGSSDEQKLTEALPLDLLTLIRRSGVLNDRQFDEVYGKVQGGEYPRDSSALADRLVKDRVLTEFQASRLLLNKPKGLLIGRYVILERLGEGSRGHVFKAQHKLMGRLVALKVIAPQIATRASSIARFYREMRLIGRLDHPNVVRAFDADQVGDLLYIVMEYVSGRSLETVLQERGPLPSAEVANYMGQAALGLSHAHERGIVHRDVKPANLLLSDEGQIKILDLGLSALMEADSATSFATAAGHAVGTVDYMSPEQATAGEIDGRSDLFCLGCTMYHLLTDQLPFPGETLAERLTRRVKGVAVPITDFRPGLPSQVVQVMGKLLACRPEDRFQTAALAAEALRALAHGETVDRFNGRSSPDPAMLSSVPAAAAPAALPEPGESPSAAASVIPGSAPSLASRLGALLAVRVPLRIVLILLGVELLALVAGFVLGQASAFLLLRSAG
jgi:serine/threonine-protein kinase